MKRWIAGALIAVLILMMAGCFQPSGPDCELPPDYFDESQPTEPESTDMDETEQEPTQTDPVLTDPMQTEPIQTEPEPTETQPPETEPMDTEPPVPTETEPDYSSCERVSAEDYFGNIIGTRWRVCGDQAVTLWTNPLYSLETEKVLFPGDDVILLGWSYYFAKVSSNGSVGYVLAKYIEPMGTDKDFYTQALNTVEYTELYTYQMMAGDLAQMTQQYPDLVELDSVGTTTWGTDIPVIRIGDEHAEYHILIQASIHGCEYITTWVVMAMVDYWIDYAMDAYADVCYHVIPMSNPDGVYTAQSCTLTDEQYLIYQSDLAKGYTYDSVESYARNWKANAVGVDLNRNFPDGWELITARKEPSSSRYAGTAPFCAPEALALKEYTLSYDFDVTMSYHTAGSVLYYEYGDDPVANAGAESLAWAINAVNGYILLGADTVDGAGYKDWAVDSLGIPSVTIELGYVHPVEAELELYSIFATESRMMAVVADWVRAYNK